jgi:hypothetical protein
MIGTLINLGLIEGFPKTKIKWQYFSKTKKQWEDCIGWDRGCRDATLYQKYGYKVRGIKQS